MPAATRRGRTRDDWAERERELLELLARYRRTEAATTACVPGSGGKDTVYASHVLKYRVRHASADRDLGAAPLHRVSAGGTSRRGSTRGFDNYLCHAERTGASQLTKLAFGNLLHPFQPFILGQKNLAPKMAARRIGIPLVFYGENEAEYGNPVAENDSRASATTRYFARTHGSRRAVLRRRARSRAAAARRTIRRPRAVSCRPIPTRSRRAGCRGALPRLLPEVDPQECYYYAVEHTGFEANTERTEGTYSQVQLDRRASTASTTTRPSSSSASAVRPTTRRRRSATDTSRVKRAWRWSTASTASSRASTSRKTSSTWG